MHIIHWNDEIFTNIISPVVHNNPFSRFLSKDCTCANVIIDEHNHTCLCFYKISIIFNESTWIFDLSNLNKIKIMININLTKIIRIIELMLQLHWINYSK